MSDMLNASHISDNLAKYESARSGFFTLLVGADGAYNEESNTNSINNLPSTNLDGAPLTSEGADTHQKILALNVTKAFVPHFELAVHEYKRGNETVKFAGVPTFQGGDITVDDVVGLDTKSILMAWQAQAYDVHTGKGGRMKHYKKNCVLIEYTQDYEQIRKWTLKGCWISKISENDFDKENDDKRQITATIEYDKAIPEKITAEEE